MQLPSGLRSASLARRYNIATGACLTHLDVERMGLLERAEIILIAENADVF